MPRRLRDGFMAANLRLTNPRPKCTIPAKASAPGDVVASRGRGITQRELDDAIPLSHMRPVHPLVVTGFFFARNGPESHAEPSKPSK